ncbi:MAG: undecaprenyldiphospho-muramoylpentapeptide beta-N-acetylglucosaminyltransferase [Crocinitomicaceae bacterium]
MKIERAIISGGGTGGHIFPAIAIADELKRRNPEVDILFVGAVGKMEMTKVPEAGYKIKGLEIVGLKRKFALSNFVLPFKIIKSLLKARKIVKSFNPQVVVGVGGYASGPTLKMATMLKYPSIVQEQNSFPGKTNKILSKSVTKICVAYDGLERFFPKEKIVFTGNPTRKEMVDINGKSTEGFEFYEFDSIKPIILILGGSLGARTLNESVMDYLDELVFDNVQVLWQCGKLYHEQLKERLKDKNIGAVKMVEFIERMDLAYAIADVVISRAGAISVSELCLVKKPTILVPSPNVSEDHQTKNAMALVEKHAAILVKDVNAKSELLSEAIRLTGALEEKAELIKNIEALGRPNATIEIVNVLEEIAKK